MTKADLRRDLKIADCWERVLGTTSKGAADGKPYRARVNERTFLNLPGFDGAAVVDAFVEDTSHRKGDDT